MAGIAPPKARASSAMSRYSVSLTRFILQFTNSTRTAGEAFSSSLATCAISSREGVMRPERPMMSTFSSLARSRISALGAITPISMTS